MLTLASCGNSGKTEPHGSLPPLPSDLSTCFEHSPSFPSSGSLTKGDVMRLIAELKLSDTAKTLCGQRLIAFYGSLSDHPKTNP
jgi:hypothetical protein